MRIWRAIADWFTAEDEGEPMLDDIVDGITEEQVRRYFEKMGADELATLRGMLAGVAKFEDLYCAALRQQGRLRKE